MYPNLVEASAPELEESPHPHSPVSIPLEQTAVQIVPVLSVQQQIEELRRQAKYRCFCGSVEVKVSFSLVKIIRK